MSETRRHAKCELTNPDNGKMSADYAQAHAVMSAARRTFMAILKDYRAGQVSETELAEAREAYRRADAAFDAAYRKAAGWTE